MDVFARRESFQRDRGTPNGVVRGVIATEGEASDGHRLSIAGLEATAPAPFLFGHDDISGRSNLGSWTSFTKGRADGVALVRGEAQVELAGVGDQAAWRQDMAHMIGAGHVSGISVRWTPTETPVPRVNLSKDHPAFVDAEKERDPRKRWGLWFPKARLLEASSVTIGSDRAAVTTRAEAGDAGAVFWKRALLELELDVRDQELVQRILDEEMRERLVPAEEDAPTARRPQRRAPVAPADLEKLSRILERRLGADLDRRVDALVRQKLARARGK